MRRIPALAGASLLLLFVAACDGGDDDAPSEPDDAKLTAVVAGGDLAVGRQRFSFVVMRGDEPVTETGVFARFFRIPASGPVLVGESPLPWTPLERGTKVDGGELEGIYYANLTFDQPGAWGLGVSLGNAYDAASEVRVQFEVASKATTLVPGDKAIAFASPTKDDLPIDRIHTGSVDDPGFHDLSITQAVNSGKPSVLVFATPAFCTTRTCGPSLQVAIKASAAFAGKVNFVHIEPFELDEEGEAVQRDDGYFKLGAAATTYRLPSEPWVFVTDKNGTVITRFSGPYALEELTYVLTELTK